MVWRMGARYWFDDAYCNEFLTQEEFDWRFKK